MSNWRIVLADLMDRGIDLYDPAIQQRPWLGVRSMIFLLVDSDSRLRAALRRDSDAEADSR